jgi:hypothetical protein
MLLANISVARFIFEHFPTCAMLRNHPAPPASNFEPLVLAVRAWAAAVRALSPDWTHSPGYLAYRRPVLGLPSTPRAHWRWRRLSSLRTAQKSPMPTRFFVFWRHAACFPRHICRQAWIRRLTFATTALPRPYTPTSRRLFGLTPGRY